MPPDANVDFQKTTYTTITMTGPQHRFLREIFGDQLTLEQIAQSVFNRAVNQAMIDKLAEDHRIGAQAPLEPQASETATPDSKNVLLMPAPDPTGD